MMRRIDYLPAVDTGLELFTFSALNVARAAVYHAQKRSSWPSDTAVEVTGSPQSVALRINSPTGRSHIVLVNQDDLFALLEAGLSTRAIVERTATDVETALAQAADEEPHAATNSER